MIKDTKFLNWEKAQRRNYYLYTISYLVQWKHNINITSFGISNIQIFGILKLQLDECMQMNAKSKWGSMKNAIMKHCLIKRFPWHEHQNHQFIIVLKYQFHKYVYHYRSMITTFI